MFNFFKKTKKQIISLTNIGDRKINQDAYESLTVADNHLLCVADGLGGHHAGEIAAQTLCAKIRLQFVKQMAPHDKQDAMNKDKFSQLIEQALTKTRTVLHNNAKAKDAHTTMAVAWIDNTQILTAHIGDSRIIAISPKSGKLWRTRDHSVVQMLVDHGEVKEEEMGTHRDQGKLTKSISANKASVATIKQHPVLKKDEIILACTDGFWEYITQKELQKIAKNPTKSSLNKYLKLAKTRASPKSDNITIQVFKK